MNGTEGCGAFVGAWLLSWLSGAVRAAVAMKGWEWFVVDTFGAPSLGFLEAWGLFLLVSFAALSYPPSSSQDERPVVVMTTAFVFSLLISATCFVSMLALVSLR